MYEGSFEGQPSKQLEGNSPPVFNINYNKYLGGQTNGRNSKNV